MTNFGKAVAAKMSRESSWTDRDSKFSFETGEARGGGGGGGDWGAGRARSPGKEGGRVPIVNDDDFGVGRDKLSW